jgi:hypothetical protein
VDSSSASLRSGPLYQQLKTHRKALGYWPSTLRTLGSAERNNVQRPTLHPSPPQSQRHKRSKFLRIFFYIFSTSCASATAVSICSSCFATKGSVCLDCTSTSRPRANASGMARWWCRCRRSRSRGKCCSKTVICLGSAAATEVYD